MADVESKLKQDITSAPDADPLFGPVASEWLRYLASIAMTAVATIMALIPMGLGVTGGSVFISKPLAIVVIGGLVSSTFLTLFLLPILFKLFGLPRETAQ